MGSGRRALKPRAWVVVLFTVVVVIGVVVVLVSRQIATADDAAWRTTVGPQARIADVDDDRILVATEERLIVVRRDGEIMGDFEAPVPGTRLGAVGPIVPDPRLVPEGVLIWHPLSDVVRVTSDTGEEVWSYGLDLPTPLDSGEHVWVAAIDLVQDRVVFAYPTEEEAHLGIVALEASTGSVAWEAVSHADVPPNLSGPAKTHSYAPEAPGYPTGPPTRLVPVFEDASQSTEAGWSLRSTVDGDPVSDVRLQRPPRTSGDFGVVVEDPLECDIRLFRGADQIEVAPIAPQENSEQHTCYLLSLGEEYAAFVGPADDGSETGYSLHLSTGTLHEVDLRDLESPTRYNTLQQSPAPGTYVWRDGDSRFIVEAASGDIVRLEGTEGVWYPGVENVAAVTEPNWWHRTVGGLGSDGSVVTVHTVEGTSLGRAVGGAWRDAYATQEGDWLLIQGNEIVFLPVEN